MTPSDVEFARIFDAPPKYRRLAVFSESRFRPFSGSCNWHDPEEVLKRAVSWQPLTYELNGQQAAGFFVDLLPNDRQSGWTLPGCRRISIADFPKGTFTYWCPIEAVAGFFAMYTRDSKPSEGPSCYVLVIKDEFFRQN